MLEIAIIVAGVLIFTGGLIAGGMNYSGLEKLTDAIGRLE